MDHASAVSFLATRLAMATVGLVRDLQASPYPSPLDSERVAIGARMTREACEAFGIGEAYSEVCAFLAASARVDVTEG